MVSIDDPLIQAQLRGLDQAICRCAREERAAVWARQIAGAPAALPGAPTARSVVQAQQAALVAELRYPRRRSRPHLTLAAVGPLVAALDRQASSAGFQDADEADADDRATGEAPPPYLLP